MYFNFENYESKGGSKEHFLNSFTKNYDLENDTYERVQKGIENFNKENNTSFDLYDYLKFNSKKIKFKKKEPLQEQGKEDLNEDLAEQKEQDTQRAKDENLEENKSFKRKHDLSKESEILNDTSLLSDVKNSLKRGAETLSDVVGLDELVNFDSDIKSKADENIKDLIKQGASYEDLNELEKNYLANKESRENVRDATNIFSKEKSIKGLATLYGTNEEEKAKKAFAEMKSTQEALSKEKFEDLNEQEKELIDKERGAVESFFVNLRDDEYKQKSFDELKEKYEAKNFISKDVLRDLEFLKNIHQSKSVSSLILSADEKEKKDYENSVLNIALNAGFDDVLVDEKEGKMYFEKDGQKYLVNEGFFDNFTNTLLANTGSITGGLIGAAKGASSAKSPQSALAKSIAYSALGSGIGASADVLATNYLLDRKNRFDEMLHHALEESALSAVGDALVLGAKPLLKTAKDSIKDFGKILDYTPLVSTTKNFPTQNIKAAQDLVEKSVPTQTQKELDEFYKAYGGRSDLADSKALDALVDTFKAKFGEDSFISKNTQRLNDILNLNSLSAKQNALFEAIRADESGFLLPYIKEVASYDVKAFKNLKNILNLSTAKLESSLKNLNLNKGDIKNILDELEKGTKEDYNEVMNEILAKTYDDRFKVVLGGGEAEEQRQILSLKTQAKDEDFFNERLKIQELLTEQKGEVVNKNTNETAQLSNKGIKKMLSDKAISKSVDNGFSKMEHLQAVANIKTLFENSQKSLIKSDKVDDKLKIYRYKSDFNINDKDAQALITIKEYDENGKKLYSLELDELVPNKLKSRGESLSGNTSNRPHGTPSSASGSEIPTSQNNYTTFRKDLQEQGLLDEEAMKFLNYVENTIYNPKGVTFTQLNNALKNINSFYKQSTNPGFKEHIKNAAQSFLREDIKKGINEIFKQDKNLYAKASKLYETSLSEYAQMKELLKASAYKKARNESTTQVKALDELIKYSKGQGKDGLNNLDFLRAKLDEKDVAILEMNLLNRLYEKSLANTDESLRVFDSTSFLNELSSLQNNAFKSKEANEFIELVKGFDKLFKNDAKIALELAPVTAKKEGSALATSAKGAVLQKVVKSGFDLVFRNLGQNVLFGAFKDSIQGAALRYHLKKALQKSDTISEFNTSFKDRLKKGQFNSKTRELSKDFLNDVENFSKNLDEEVLKDTKASDESIKDLPRENISKEVAEATPSDTTSQSLKSTITHNLSPQEIKEYISKWDLSNPSKDDKLLITKVEGEELELLKKEFDFKGNYELAREIDAQHIAHALNRHTQDKNQANININIDEILEHYPNITKNYDKRVFTKDNTIIYAKQINGHFIVIEEVLTGKNKLRFDTAWKQNGKLNEEVLFKNAKAFPNTEKQHKVATATQNLDQIQGGTSHNQSLSDNIKPQTAGVEPATTTSNMKQSSTESISLEDKDNSSTNTAKRQEENTTQIPQEQKKDLPKISKDLQEQWIKEFNLKSIDEAFTPSFKPEVKEALEKAGITEDLHLKIGSLIKLNNRQRQEFLPYIKPTIQEPNLVLDNGRGILFIKEFTGEDKSRYFMSVAKDYNGEWIFSTHTRKELKDIQKEVKKSKIFYNKGFKGEEVAGASDILEPGGTTTKPSDLQIEYPANHSSGINPKEHSSTKEPLLSKAETKKQEVLNKIKSKEHKEYLRLQTKLEESKELEAQAFKELEPIKQRFLAQTKAKEYYAQAIEKLDISAFNAYQIKDELKPIFSRIKKARREQEHYKERLFSYPLKKLQGKSLTFNEKEFPLYENALTLKQSHSIDKNPKLIKERVALRKAIESHLDIKPIKEFGTNYAEHYRDGQGAIAKILSEAKDYEARKEAGRLTQAEIEQGAYKGQVAGAFYKEELGDIDVVWGDSHFGLQHILERRTQDFIKEGLSEAEAKTKAREFVESIPEIIENGKIRKEKTRAFIEFNDKQSVIALDYKGDDSRKWLLTAYKNYDDAPSPAYSHQDRHNINTSSETRIDGDIKNNSSTNPIKLQANQHLGTGNTKKVFDLSNKDDMQELKAFFHTHSTDTQEAKELFNRVLEQAQHFKIKVNFTNDLPRGASGEYDKYYLVKILDDYRPEYKAQTLFHELIHSVTTNAIMLVNVRTHLDKTTLLHPKQIEAVNTITTIYKDIKTKFPKFSAVSRNYGMKNEFEFVAELANPEFRDKLKKLNVFEKIVDAITKIVVYLKDSVRGYGKPTGNVYEKTKKALIDIIDNYDKDFLEKYIKTYKKEGMSSQAHYNLKLETKFLNEEGEIDFRALEGEAVTLPKALKFSAFKESILQSSNAKPQSNNKVSYKSIIGDININLGYTYSHFFKNGNGKENRFNLTGALIQILDNPLFVTKDKKGAYYFYKPFKDEKGFKHLVSISVDKNGKIEYRTSYEASNTRLKQMIKMHELAYLKE